MDQDTSRRDFLKRAGAVAWVVPTMQVVNMTAAMAGADGAQGSVVATSAPPPPARCRCELSVLDYWQGDGGWVFKVRLHLSDGCDGRADNVSISVNSSEPPGGVPIEDYYLVAVEQVPATVSVEVHDSDGGVLTSCNVTLNVEE